jgi:hypothetical protein
MLYDGYSSCVGYNPKIRACGLPPCPRPLILRTYTLTLGLYLTHKKQRHGHFMTLRFGVAHSMIFYHVQQRHCDYRSLGSVSTLTKMNKFFLSKNKFVFKFWNQIFFHHLLSYCDLSREIIQNVAYDNYDDFQHVNFVFSQIFISLSWGLFNDETDLRVRY